MLLDALRYSKEEKILQFFTHVVEESGTTFEQNLLGGRGVNTVDPKNIEAILSTNFNRKVHQLGADLKSRDPYSEFAANLPLVGMLDYGLGLRAPTFHPLLGSGIFTQDGAAWRSSRGLLRPQFSSNRWENFEQIKRGVQGLIDAIPEDGVVDLQPLCFKLTFDTTMFILFGNSVSANDWDQVTGQESKFAEAFNSAQEYLAYRGRLGTLHWVLNTRRFRDACKICHQFVDEAVSKALETSQRSKAAVAGDEKGEKRTYVFVEALMEQTQDPQVIRDQCLNVLLAGRDTTGCCLQWTL